MDMETHHFNGAQFLRDVVAFMNNRNETFNDKKAAFTLICDYLHSGKYTGKSDKSAPPHSAITGVYGVYSDADFDSIITISKLQQKIQSLESLLQTMISDWNDVLENNGEIPWENPIEAIQETLNEAEKLGFKTHVKDE